MLNGVLTVHVPKKGDAYLAGTVHVAKEVQTIQRYQLEPYMSEKRVKPESATVHVAKCFPIMRGFWFLHNHPPQLQTNQPKLLSIFTKYFFFE